MLYTYTIYTTNEDATEVRRTHITTRLEEIGIQDVTHPFWVEVYDNTTRRVVTIIKNNEALEEWQHSQERAHAWKSPKREAQIETVKADGLMKTASAVKPNHYKNFIDEYQWLDVMSRIHRYENPEVFKGAVELQVRKYLDRNGKKDAELQELMKGLFYYIYLVMYIKNGEKPILAKDIHKIMESLNES